MGWPWQSKEEPICKECEEAKQAPKPANAAHGDCADLYALVDACMKREDRQSVKECANEWKAFKECHAATARRHDYAATVRPPGSRPL